MATNRVQRGDVIQWTNGTGADVSSGDLVEVNATAKIVGICAVDIKDTESGSVYIVGVFSVAKKSSDTPAQGAKLYWDSTNKELTTTASGNTLAGMAFDAATASDTTVNIKLNQFD